jgi:hypothetical protein
LHFQKSAHVKLSQTQLALDPRVAKLSHSSAAAVACPRFLGRHFLAERLNRCTFFDAQQPSATLLVFRAAL